VSARHALPPGPRRPRLVNTVDWLARPLQTLDRLAERYGEAFTLRVSRSDWVFFTDPAVIREVFTASTELIRAGEANTVLRPILGDRSLLLLDGENHLRQRKLMLPAFHGHQLKRWRETITEVAETEIEKWPRGRPIKVWEHLQALTLDVIQKVVFGVDDEEQAGRLRAGMRRFGDWTSNPARTLGLVLGGSQSVRIPGLKQASAGVEAVIAEQLTRARHLDGPRDVVLGSLVAAHGEDGRGLSDGEVHDALMTLLIAGHETTASALGWAIERLARHPALVAQARAAARGGDESYLEALVQEVLRLRPIVPAILRAAGADVELAGYRLPAGTRVAIPIHLVHRRPSEYPEPTEFRPERFLGRPPATYTWIPFGGGTRRCVGAGFAQLEMKIVLRVLLEHAELTPAIDADESPRRRFVTLAPDRGAEVVLS
jgi:cytochrome P450 family 135